MGVDQFNTSQWVWIESVHAVMGGDQVGDCEGEARVLTDRGKQRALRDEVPVVALLPDRSWKVHA